MRFSELNRYRVGLVGTVTAAALLLGTLNAGTIVNWISSQTYKAEFSEAGGLREGDEVRVAGTPVGEVQDVSLDGAQVDVSFSVRRGVPVGTDSRLAVKSRDLLGRMYLQLEPAGEQPQDPSIIVPVSRTTSPYDLNTALSDLGTEATALNTTQMASALNAISSAFRDTPAPLRESIKGFDQLSRTISSRDIALRELLSHTNAVSGVLDQRRAQLVDLFDKGNALLADLNAQRDVIVDLLDNVSDLSNQLSGFVDDNKKRIGPSLDQLHRTVDILNSNADNIQKSIDGLRRYITQLGEALGTGPFVLGTIQNLPPTNLLPLLPALLERPHK
jgi:phospholipid/cholesterol/gamma-HCH transport system substrate-binding protein